MRRERGENHWLVWPPQVSLCPFWHVDTDSDQRKRVITGSLSSSHTHRICDHWYEACQAWGRSPQEQQGAALHTAGWEQGLTTRGFQRQTGRFNVGCAARCQQPVSSTHTVARTIRSYSELSTVVTGPSQITPTEVRMVPAQILFQVFTFISPGSRLASSHDIRVYKEQLQL